VKAPVPADDIPPPQWNVPQVVSDSDISGGLVGIAGSQADAFLWRPGETPRPLQVGASNGFAFSPDGSHFVTTSRPLVADQKPTAYLWRTDNTHHWAARLPLDAFALHHPSFAPNGDSIVFAFGLTGALIWRPATGDTTPVGTAPATAATYSPDGSLIVMGGPGGAVTIWNAHTRKQEGPVRELGSANVVAARFAPDSIHIAAGTEGGNVAVWNIQTGQRVELPPLPAIVTDVRFSTDGKWLLIASTDGTVRVWDWQHNVVLATLQVHAGATRTAQFMPGQPPRILSTGDDGITEVTTCKTCVQSIDDLITLAHAHQEQLAPPAG
jgi:WD40 repeat protein